MLISVIPRIIIFLMLLIASPYTFAACSYDNPSISLRNTFLWVAERNNPNNRDLSWDVTCDNLGGVMTPRSSKDPSWDTYINNIMSTYNIPLTDITLTYQITLMSEGRREKVWNYDMKQSQIVSDISPFTLQANKKYTILMTNRLGLYNSVNAPNTRPRVASPRLSQVMSVDGSWINVGSIFVPSNVVCNATSFEVRPSASEIDFGLLDIRAINRGRVYSRDFSIEIRRNPANTCINDFVYPEISFRHHGTTNSNGDLILPIRRLLFRLLDENGNRIHYGEKLEMGVLTRTGSLTNRYRAQVLKDPTQPEVVAGVFQATIVYDVTYR